MESIDSVKSSSDEHKELFTNTNANDKVSDVNSFRVHISHSPLWSSESDLSLTMNQELSMCADSVGDSDELPAFEIRLISPLSRSPSPIDSDFETLTMCNPTSIENTPNIRSNNPEFITLQDINSLISLPIDECGAAIRRVKSLETIFEGVFLNTPPKMRNSQSKCSNMLEKLELNQLQCGKENTAPDCRERIPKTLLKSSICRKNFDFREFNN